MKVNGFDALTAYRPKSPPHGGGGPSFAEQEAARSLSLALDRFGMEVKDLSGKEGKEEKEKQDSWWEAWWMSGYNPNLYQQQQAAANGVTVTEALAKGMQLPGEKSTEPLLALTEEQIAELNSKYDLENMEWPSAESEALGDELFSLGVITEEQRDFFRGLVRYTGPITPSAILTPAGEEPPRLETHYQRQPGDSMLDILMGELAVQNKNLDDLKSPDSPEKRKRFGEDSAAIANAIRAVEEYRGQYQSVYDLLSQLM